MVSKTKYFINFKYFSSFLKENLENNSTDIQREVPIKSANSFLYEYWNVFFYLYSTKLLEKFKNIKSETTEHNLLDSISLNNIFINNDIDNSFKISEKEINKDSINLNNNNMSINNQINNNPVNFPSQNNNKNNIKSSLFQPQNNNINIGNIYNNNYSGILPNSQNDLFRNKIPSIPNISNNLNINTFYHGPKSIQNNFGNEIRHNLFGELDNKNNLETNIPFFQIPLQNPISMTQMPNNIVSNNIMPNSIPSNFLITNNTNINTNSNININKNINNIINFNNKNVINTNINNNININTVTDSKNLIFSKNTLNQNLQNENNININNNKEINSNLKNTPKIIFSSTNYNNINTINKKNEQQQKKAIDEGNLPTKKTGPLFNIKESSLMKEKFQKAQLTSKKRKRFIKNNKLVFVQVDKETNKKEENKKEKNESEEEENNNDESLNSEKVSELIQKNTKPRGSRYRGVSKNGSQWQVLIMVKKKKRYLGSFSNEEEAARAYDRVALQHHGIKAKTNYDYTKDEIKKIMEGPKLLNIE